MAWRGSIMAWQHQHRSVAKHHVALMAAAAARRSAAATGGISVVAAWHGEMSMWRRNQRNEKYRAVSIAYGGVAYEKRKWRKAYQHGGYLVISMAAKQARNITQYQRKLAAAKA